MEKNKYIQILRGLSLLLVVGYHLTIPGFTSGYLGVDIFLVISGFLITGKIIDSGYKIKEFYIKRVTRLIPALIFNLSLFSLLFYLINKKVFTDINALEGIYATLQLTNIRLFIQTNNYFQSEVFNPFQHLWSLGVEEQFYLIWPWFILFLLRFTEKIKIIILFLLSLISLIAYTLIDQPSYYYFPLTRFWELFIGGGLYLIYKNTKILSKIKLSKQILLIVPLLLIILTNANISTKLTQVITVGLAVLYISCSTKIEFNKNKSKIMTYVKSILEKIGDMSYSLYLVHYLTLGLVLRFLNINKLPLGLALITLTLTFLMGFISYKIERSFNKPKYFIKIILLLGSTILALFLVYLPLLFTPHTVITSTPKSVEQLELIIEKSINYSNSELLANNKPTLNQLAQEKSYFPSTSNCPNGVYSCYVSDKKNESNPKNIILYGDSHAQMWWPALYEYAKNNHINSYLIFKGGCPPAPLFKGNIKNGDIGTMQSMELCNLQYGKNIKIIKRMKPDLLIITGSHKTATWIENFQTTVDNLSDFKNRIVYVKDFYYPREDIIDCYYQNPEKTYNCPTKQENDIIVNERIRENIIIDRNKIKDIEVIDLICSKTICPGVVDHLYVYLDKFHLSATYSTYLSDIFMKRVMEKYKDKKIN